MCVLVHIFTLRCERARCVKGRQICSQVAIFPRSFYGFSRHDTKHVLAWFGFFSVGKKHLAYPETTALTYAKNLHILLKFAIFVGMENELK